MVALPQMFDATTVDPTSTSGLPIGRHPVIIVASEWSVDGFAGYLERLNEYP